MPRNKRDIVTETELPADWKDDEKYWTGSDGKRTLLRDLTATDRQRIQHLLRTHQEQVLEAVERERQEAMTKPLSAKYPPEFAEGIQRLRQHFEARERERVAALTPEQVDREKARAVEETKMMKRLERIYNAESGFPSLRNGTIRPRTARRWDTY